MYIKFIIAYVIIIIYLINKKLTDITMIRLFNMSKIVLTFFLPIVRSACIEGSVPITLADPNNDV